MRDYASLKSDLASSVLEPEGQVEWLRRDRDKFCHCGFYSGLSSSFEHTVTMVGLKDVWHC